LLDLIANAGARFEPRERVEYNDSNYLVLGFMLETIQDRSYDDILVRQIVGKLGMSRTYFAGSGNARLESRPYRHTSSGWVAQNRPTRPSRAARSAWCRRPRNWCDSSTRCSRASW
jgi:CubicO group peptidase (beta-lactamase class C family)